MSKQVESGAQRRQKKLFSDLAAQQQQRIAIAHLKKKRHAAKNHPFNVTKNK